MTYPSKRARLLIVDDIRANVEILVEALRSDYEISVALDGKSALKVVEWEHPDLILLDVVMPGMDGFEVCRALKAEPNTRDIPVLFITSLESPQDSITAFEAGGIDFIRKPFHRDEVVARVRAHIQLVYATYQIQAINKDLGSYIDIVDHYVLTTSINDNQEIIYASRAFCARSGYSSKELLGNKNDILCPQMRENDYKTMLNSMHEEQSWAGEIKYSCKDGSEFYTWSHIDPVVNTHGNLTGFISIYNDLTDKKRLEALSVTDELTDLFNRRKFNAIFPIELNRAKRDGKAVALLMLDIDHFKMYNDTYGHQAGDNTLRAIGGVLRAIYKRSGDFVFRMGGEEFATIFVADDPKYFFEISENIRQSVEDLKISHKNNTASPYVTTSIGMHYCQGLGIKSQEEIYKLADQALYMAKNMGRNRVEYSMT